MFYVMLVDLCCWVKSYFVFCGTIKVVRYTTRFIGVKNSVFSDHGEH